MHHHWKYLALDGRQSKLDDEENRRLSTCWRRDAVRSSTARSAEGTIKHVQSISVAFEPACEEMMFVDSK